MASAVDIAPSLGHGLVASQAGPTLGYDAIDDRRYRSTGLQEGVIDAGSYMVVQRAAGANMSVDVNASTGAGAYVLGDSVAAQGLYYIAPHQSVVNLDVATADPTNPRVDVVVIDALDDAHDSGGLNKARVRVISGTPSSGANLTNRTGAPSLPNSALLLADVLVAATASSIPNSAIRDRRKWARGAYRQITRAAGDYTTSATTYDLIDATNLAPRIECGGFPIRVTLTVSVYSFSGIIFGWVPTVDGAGVNGMAAAGAAGSFTNGLWWEQSPNSERAHHFHYEFTPSAGSHKIAPAVAGPATDRTLRANSTLPLVWTIEEIIRQNTANNTTTSG